MAYVKCHCAADALFFLCLLYAALLFKMATSKSSHSIAAFCVNDYTNYPRKLCCYEMYVNSTVNSGI